MSTSQPDNQANDHLETDLQNLYPEPPHGLDSEAHTTQRLVFNYFLAALPRMR